LGFLFSNKYPHFLKSISCAFIINAIEDEKSWDDVIMSFDIISHSGGGVWEAGEDIATFTKMEWKKK
jgi:hypothetical protein